LAVAGTKIFSDVMRATGWGYIGGVAADAAISCAGTYAIGKVAKAYFSLGLADAELKDIFKKEFDQAKKHYTKARLQTLAQEAKHHELDYEILNQVLGSPFGREIVRYTFQAYPDVKKKITSHKAWKVLEQTEEVSIRQLQEIEQDGQLASELWNVLRDEYELQSLIDIAIIFRFERKRIVFRMPSDEEMAPVS
jgi:hypothetical protein